MSSAELSPTPGATRILIACIGNIFFGDDGFGVEVARRLASHRYPPGVEVVDFGIRGVDLAYTLLDGCDTLLLVDATPRGGLPGTVYVIEPELPPASAEARPAATETTQTAKPERVALDAHSMDPIKTLTFAYQLGARPGRVLLVGCEPETPPTADVTDDSAMRMGLSAPVRQAVDEAVVVIDELVARLYEPAESVRSGN